MKILAVFTICHGSILSFSHMDLTASWYAHQLASNHCAISTEFEHAVMGAEFYKVLCVFNICKVFHQNCLLFHVLHGHIYEQSCTCCKVLSV